MKSFSLILLEHSGPVQVCTELTFIYFQIYSRNGQSFCMVCFISLLTTLWRHRGSGNNFLLFVVRVSMRRIFYLGYYKNSSSVFKFIINFVFGYKTKFDSEKILKHDILKMIPKWTLLT